MFSPHTGTQVESFCTKSGQDPLADATDAHDNNVLNVTGETHLGVTG